MMFLLRVKKGSPEGDGSVGAALANAGAVVSGGTTRGVVGAELPASVGTAGAAVSVVIAGAAVSTGAAGTEVSVVTAGTTVSAGTAGGVDSAAGAAISVVAGFAVSTGNALTLAAPEAAVESGVCALSVETAIKNNKLSTDFNRFINPNCIRNIVA